MALTRPSQAFSDKSNVNPSVNRQQEATAEDFIEASIIINEIIDEVEGLNQSASQNPYYGSYTSLAILQATHSDALTDGWAIIDAGAGITPQIAAWDDVNSLWELTSDTQIHIYVNTVADLPATGLPNKDYITNDMLVRVWHNGEYKIKSPQGVVSDNLITIAGLPFQLVKNKVIPNNNNSTLETSDIIKGFIASGYIEAQYLGGDNTDFENENVYKIFNGI